jgi:hypothetical protein
LKTPFERELFNLLTRHEPHGSKLFSWRVEATNRMLEALDKYAEEIGSRIRAEEAKKA